eukprot:1942-Hanusia_phi.AAC.5
MERSLLPVVVLAGQAMQYEVLPGEKKPELQSAQKVDAFKLEYWPGRQATQGEAPFSVLYIPAGQGLQVGPVYPTSQTQAVRLLLTTPLTQMLHAWFPTFAL